MDSNLQIARTNFIGPLNYLDRFDRFSRSVELGGVGTVVVGGGERPQGLLHQCGGTEI